MTRPLMIAVRCRMAVLLMVLSITYSISYAQTAEGYIAKLAKCDKAVDSSDNYTWAAISTVGEYDMAKGFVYGQKAIALGKKAKDNIRQAAGYFAISNLFFSTDETDSAKLYAHKCLEQYDLVGKKGRYYTYALNIIAGHYLNKGSAVEALDYAHRQLEAAAEVKDSVSISNSYTMLSAIYDMMGNINESIRYSKMALEINERTGNLFNRSVVLSNLAMLYNATGRYQEALPYLYKAIYFSTEVDYTPRHQTTAYILVGECHNKMKHYDSALHYLSKADRMIENIDVPQDRIKLLMIYGSTLRELGRYKEGIVSLQRAMAIAKDKKLTKLHSLTANSLSEIAALNKDYEIAFTALKEHNTLEYNLSSVEVQNTIAELKEKYESEKKDARIAQEKRNSKLLASGLLIAALMVGLLLTQYIRQRAANITIRKQSDKLTLLMKELHHRVKNNLQIISSLLSLQSFRIKDEKASRAVREGQQRIEAMSLIHQRLYTRDNITEINIKEYITDLVESLLSTYGYNKNDIDIKLDVSDELMNVDQAIPLSLIVNELATNALKYAYEGSNTPVLSISLNRKNGKIVLRVADNGKGLNIDEWNDKEGSFGKELIQTFVKQLNGYLDIVVDKGSQFTLSIPQVA